MSSLIDFENVKYEYNADNDEVPTVEVLHDINCKIEEGSFVAVLGHNGSGKSTMAKHINAILIPSNGVVYVDGIDTKNEEMLFDIRQQVGMVFQNPDNQLVATIVEEDVAFALENLGEKPSIIRKKVDESLKEVGMYKYREHAPHQLSGGQKQRVAIAGILAMQPKCIVLDEPTAMLDPKGRKEVLSTIKRLNKEHGTTIIYITHFMDEAIEADRVLVVDNGKIIADDIPKNVFSNVEGMKSIGLDVPQVTELSYLLRKAGINMPDNILTVDECVDELVKLLEETKCQ